MANTFLNPAQIARAALGVLGREIVLPQLVWRMAAADFRGTRNDTVTVRVPVYLEAREYNRNRAQPIVIDDINEIGVDVKLDRMIYSAVALTDEQLTLEITAFGEQVLSPQSRAVVRALEQIVATAIETAPFAWTVNEADPFLAAAKARAELNKAGVPLAARALLLGADVETAFLSSPLFVRADTSGSTDALRDARIGRVAGMDTYVSAFIDPDTAYAFHQSAFALANVAPVVPDGASFGASQTYEGYAVRWLRDYDAQYLRDRSVLSSLVGCTSVNDGVQVEQADKNVRVVKITGIEAPGS